MPPPWAYTQYNLRPDEAAIITTYANGCALEFGSGRGLGTHALLAGRIDHVLSIDESEDFTSECGARFSDPRVEWRHLEVGGNGWYDHGQIEVPPEPEDKFTTVILDGPADYTARVHCLPMLLGHAYLAPDWQLIVTRTSLPEVKAFLKEWLQEFAIQREAIYCERGMVRITAMV